MSLKKQVADLVAQNDLDGVVALAERERMVLRYLVSLLYEREGERRWRAVEAVGRVAEQEADRDEERVRDLLRNLMWALNDESGNMPWGAPEAVGEIVARRPELFGGFAANLVYNYLDEPTVTRGVLWAIGRIGRHNPELVAEMLPAVESLLGDPDPEIRGYAAWALAENGAKLPGAAERLRSDERVIEIWENGRLIRMPVKEVATRLLDTRKPSDG